MNFAKLPPYKGIRKLISASQSTDDIINEVLDAHLYFAGDYNSLVDYFDTPDRYALAQKLFKFCKDNIKYKVESENHQTTRSAAAILRLGHGDCKHYAGFIAGVTDAINRKTGDNINWCYRFASYDIIDPTPVHVFIVIKDYGREIWIDPVLNYLDQRTPTPQYFVDKKIKKVMLERISGAPGQVGVSWPTTTTQSTGTTAQTPYTQAAAQMAVVDNVVTSSIPFYGLAKGLIENFFGKGGISDWLSPSGILNEIKFALSGRLYRGGQYWLGEKFKYYILGEDIHTRDADVVTDPAVATAITVFSVGFGVPIEDYQDILNLGIGRDAYINRYLTLGASRSDISTDAVDRAVTLKKTYFPFNEVTRGVVPKKWNPADFNKIPLAVPVPDFTKDYPAMWRNRYTGAIPGGGEVRDGIIIQGFTSNDPANPTGSGVNPYDSPLLPGQSFPTKTILIVGGLALAGYFLLKKRGRN